MTWVSILLFFRLSIQQHARNDDCISRWCEFFNMMIVTHLNNTTLVPYAQRYAIRDYILSSSDITIGDSTLRTYSNTSAQKAITFLCLDFSGTSVTYNSLPPTTCPDGVRSQIVSSFYIIIPKRWQIFKKWKIKQNFPSCWDGKVWNNLLPYLNSHNVHKTSTRTLTLPTTSLMLLSYPRARTPEHAMTPTSPSFCPESS